MKNIILVDVCEFGIDSMMALEDVFIAALVVDTPEQGKKLQEKFPNRIGQIVYRITKTYEDFLELYKTNYSIKKDDIHKYRYAQLKVEHYLHREVLDYNEFQYRYFIGLSYWLGIFEQYHIDAVISMHLEHGGLFDSIIFEIAKENGIPVFNQNTELHRGTHIGSSFYCLNTDEPVNLNNITDKYANIALKNYIHTVVSPTSIKDKKVFFDFLWTKPTVYIKNFQKSFWENTSKYDYWYNLSKKEKKQNTRYIEHLKKIYERISESPSVENEKYIFYALHLEPEATIMNRDAFTSQLHLIKLLSESLPDGWKLYVKEHPHQFKLKGLFTYFLRNIFLFRTEQFYRNILNNKNVRLIKVNEHSHNLIVRSQGVATICGSIILETIVQNKPIFIFGSKSTVFSKVKDTFCITSKTDIDEDLQRIQNGFCPDYSNINEVVENYLYETADQEVTLSIGTKDFLVDIFAYMLNIKEIIR